MEAERRPAYDDFVIPTPPKPSSDHRSPSRRQVLVQDEQQDRDLRDEQMGLVAREARVAGPADTGTSTLTMSSPRSTLTRVADDEAPEEA